MRTMTLIALAACLALTAGCDGDKSADSEPSAKASTDAKKPGATKPASTKSDASGPAAGGTMTVPKLMAAVEKDEKAVEGKKTKVEGVFWGMWKETSEGKTTHHLSIVASKDDTDTKVTCRMSDEPKGLPKAEMDAHKQAIPIMAEGTLGVRANGKAYLADCTFKKK